MQHALKNMPELRNGNIELTSMLDKPAVILAEILKCDFVVAMLYLAKHECRGTGHSVALQYVGIAYLIVFVF
jgi:hypothetical protein